MSPDPVADGMEKMGEAGEVAAKKRKTDNDKSTDINEGSGIVVADEEKETSFDDLPDDILLTILTYLDLPSRLQLRVNKRLERLQFTVKNQWKILRIDIAGEGYKMFVRASNCVYRHTFGDLSQLEKTLRRLSFNTSVDLTSIEIDRESNEECIRAIAALSNFEAECLHVWSFRNEGPIYLQVDLPTLLTLSANIRDVKFTIRCNLPSAHELSTLRKAMFEGNCRMEKFYMNVNGVVTNSFVKECLGITIEEDLEPRHTKVYRTKNESIELFTRNIFDQSNILTHFEGDLQTTLSGLSISLKKSKSEALSNFFWKKIELNHVYEE